MQLCKKKCDKEGNQLTTYDVHTHRESVRLIKIAISLEGDKNSELFHNGLLR
jgi:hypothetical protein